MTFFNFLDLEFTKLNDQITNWLRGTYNKSEITFTSASPHGQIINVMKEFYQHTMITLKNSLSQIDINNTYNEKLVRSIARISGHNATRAISAKGVIKLTLQEGINLTEKIGTNNLIINNNTLIKNQSNGLYYTIQTNEDFSTYSFDNNKSIYLNIIQGKFETISFTGNGLENQSFSVSVANSALVENFEIYVTYNGINVDLCEHLYDMLKGSYSCYIRTGMNGGIDVYFGTINYGIIPQIGSQIKIRYLLSDGTSGDIENNSMNDFKFVDEIKSVNGDTISIDDYFDISIEKDIKFSSNGESVNFTKSMLPYVSRNFVLATPEQFIYHLKRLNMFSQVSAYNLLNDYDSYNKNQIITSLKKDINDYIVNTVKKQDILNKITYLDDLNITNDNKIFLYLVPDITKYFSKDINYFNIALDAFYLDDDEKNRIYNYLKKMGILVMNSDVEIIQPIISKYAMYIYVRRFDDSVEDNVRQEIINIVSNFFINNQRFDRVIKSDIIKNIKNLTSIDSVDIFFISEKNEIYHKDGKLSTGKAPVILEKPIIIKNEVVYEIKDYDASLTLGIDTIMGDVIVEKNELPIIRGGWSDRNDTYYSEIPTTQGLSPINIIFKGVTKRNI